MAVIGFRSHSIEYLSEDKGYYSENGDYISSRKRFSEAIMCNAVPNSGEASVKDVEGKKSEYSFTLYCNPDVKDFAFGELIRLNREGIMYELTVKGFQRYTNMVKIWV